MYFQIQQIAIDYDRRDLVLTDSANPVFTWAARHSERGAYQAACALTVSDETQVLWDSGWVNTRQQRATYQGAALKSGCCYTVTLRLKDQNGVETAPAEAKFRYLGAHSWQAKWITTDRKEGRKAQYFYRGFTLKEMPVSATLYACGLGYQYITVNGVDVEKSFLNPAVTQYNKACYYTVTDVTDALQEGRNGLFAIVGDGWRDPQGFFDIDREKMGDRLLFGDTRLIAELELCFADGSRQVIASDESWLGGFGAIVSNSLFDGEMYDAGCALPGWDTPGFDGAGLTPVVEAKGRVGQLLPQTLPPVVEQKRLKAQVIRRLEDGAFVYDFGQNIAGLGCLTIPKGLRPGTRITVEFAEEILPSGDLDKETLRRAKVTDVFIAGEENPETWMPRLTYHGFRFAKISGLDFPADENTLVAVVFCNDIKNNSFFRCGDPLINQLQENIVRTEMNNLHHLATDCPQRDERMGWMNDATVRFEESPYNFHMGRLFPKILLDIALEQDPVSGTITDTAPVIWGNDPADPVCSSFLVMGLQMARHYGDIENIRRYYEPFKRWNACIAALRNEEGIVNYTSWGDWAGPADYCDGRFDGPHSTVTPGELMSTGYHYYNYKLLACFAALLGDEQEKEAMLAKAAEVQQAFLNKWFDAEHGCYVHNGSQGSQAFALWLGILPPEYEKQAARVMFEAVKNVGYRLTTGNLTTKYLIDMLTKYGYTDAAWKLLTRKEYPSWGYMIANGATTVWERFEFKRGSGMNSHDHPMYGAVGYWFYAYLLGVTPTGWGWQHFRIAPCFPSELMLAEGRVDTHMGEIYIRWQRQSGSIDILVDVPFGAEATLVLPDGERQLTSGSHAFSFED